uniref:Putative secreted protein ovary overexpressed n=1 Tax=Rhipicephalus microplus TaxID=6941 RepID=A0A6M2DA31_RHIMP
MFCFFFFFFCWFHIAALISLGILAASAATVPCREQYRWLIEITSTGGKSCTRSAAADSRPVEDCTWPSVRSPLNRGRSLRSVSLEGPCIRTSGQPAITAICKMKQTCLKRQFAMPPPDPLK